MIALTRTKSVTARLLNKWYFQYMRTDSVVSFDIETTGLDSSIAKIFSFCIGHIDGTSEVYRLDTSHKLKNRQGWIRLQQIFDDITIGKIAHNYKFEYKFLIAAGIKIPNGTIWHDTMLMSRILRNLAPSHKLDYLCWEIGGYEIDTPLGTFGSREIDAKVQKQAESRGNRYDRVDKELMYYYQIADAERPILLYLAWIDTFRKDQKLYKDYINEILTTATTALMENVGVTLDWKNANELVEDLETKLDKVLAESFKYFGEYINLNSDNKVRRLLYKRYCLPVIAKTKSHLPATDKTTIIDLAKQYPLYKKPLHLILKTRAYTNALSMLQGYMDRADEQGTIHPTINSCQARTHRQSGENPNMQNVSKGIQDPEKNPYPVLMRNVFRTPIGYFLCLGDYAGIEMRLIVELAGSRRLIDAIARGENLHVIACKLFYGELFKSKKENPNLYQFGKNAHFALGYGAGFHKLAKVLGIPVEEGMNGLLRYREEYPEIAYLNRNIAETIKNQGYIVSPFGNKLYVPVQKAYSGLNYLIQCTAAKILKRAEVTMTKYFEEQWDNRVRLMMVIHDEVLLKFERGLIPYRDQILYDTSRLMCDMPEIKIPLDVEWKKTTSIWERAKSCLLYTSPSPRDRTRSRMPSSA